MTFSHIILSHTPTFLLKAQEEKSEGKDFNIYIIKEKSLLSLGSFAKFIFGPLTTRLSTPSSE